MATKQSRYAVLTPFDDVAVVAGICMLAGFDAAVVPSSLGAVILRDVPVPQYDEWDIRTITGPDEAELERLEQEGSADSGPAVAAHFSRLTKYGVVLIEVTLADTTGFEEGTSGEVKARRYIGGKSSDEIVAGLVLQSFEERYIEDFLLGSVKAEDIEGAVNSQDMSTADLERLARRVQSGKKRRVPTNDEVHGHQGAGNESGRPESNSADAPSHEGEQ